MVTLEQLGELLVKVDGVEGNPAIITGMLALDVLQHPAVFLDLK